MVGCKKCTLPVLLDHKSSNCHQVLLNLRTNSVYNCTLPQNSPSNAVRLSDRPRNRTSFVIILNKHMLYSK